MTTDQIYTIIITSIGVTGTLLGTLLIPFITNQQERNRIKRELKPLLVKKVYEFFTYRKKHLQITNWNAVRVRNLTTIFRVLNDPTVTNEAKIQYKVDYDNLNSFIERENGRTIEFIHKLVDIESDLHSIIIKVRDYFRDATKYASAIDLIIVQINEFNKGTNLYDYNKLEQPEFDVVQKGLDNALQVKQDELSEMCKAIIFKIEKDL